MNKKNDLLTKLTQELETVSKDKNVREQELQQLNEHLLPLLFSKLKKMQKDMEEREALESADRERIQAHFSELMHKWEQAQEALRLKEEELQALKDENKALKELADRSATKRGEIEESQSSDDNHKPRSEDERRQGTVDRVKRKSEEWESGEEGEGKVAEEEGGEDTAKTVREDHNSHEHANGTNESNTVHEKTQDQMESEKEKVEEGNLDLDSLKNMLESEFNKLNEELASAEQFSKKFKRKTLALGTNIERIKTVGKYQLLCTFALFLNLGLFLSSTEQFEKGRIAIMSGDQTEGDKNAKGDHFEGQIKTWPRELLEKQIRHYRVELNPSEY